HGQDGCGDGGADGGLGRLPDHLRHGQGGRPRHGDRRYPTGREDGRQVGRLPRRGALTVALLPVDEALARLLEDILPTEAELLPLHDAAGRVLASDIVALRTQPPFDASAMDGYAVRAADTQVTGARLRVIGESPA